MTDDPNPTKNLSLPDGWEVHPAADIFPFLSEDDLRALAADIDNNGLQFKLGVWKDRTRGVTWLIDGRNRWLALKLLGRDPTQEVYYKTFKDDAQVAAVVASLNLTKRHLSTSQKAMMAARLLPMFEARAKARQGARTDLVANLPPSSPHKARDDAASTLGVSARSVQYAKAILKDGIPQLTHAVETGKAAVSQAVKVARLPPEDQNLILRAIKDGTARNLQDAHWRLPELRALAKGREYKSPGPTRNERLARWQRRAQRLLVELDQAGIYASRLEAAEAFLGDLKGKVEAIRKHKEHLDRQPRERHPDVDMPYVLPAWRGPSEIDGAPIRVIASCLKMKSGSRKTGDMIPITLVRDDVDPSTALQQGLDRSVCGDCKHRPANLSTCYVVPAKRAVRVPWESTAGVETDLDGSVEAIRQAGVPVRLGVFGNPSSVPFDVAEKLLEATQDETGRSRHTSYEHRWRICDPRWRGVSMASVDTPKERAEAKAAGWRTFRVKLPDEPVLSGEIVCPATQDHDPKVTCAACLLCSGTAGRGDKDIVLDIHGSGGKVDRFVAWKRSLVGGATLQRLDLCLGEQ